MGEAQVTLPPDPNPKILQESDPVVECDVTVGKKADLDTCWPVLLTALAVEAHGFVRSPTAGMLGMIGAGYRSPTTTGASMPQDLHCFPMRSDSNSKKDLSARTNKTKFLLAFEPRQSPHATTHIGPAENCVDGC